MDSFYIYHSDDFRGPVFTLTTQTGGGFVANALSNFNWNSSAWYYLGVSFDHTGALFYFRELSANSVTTPTVQTLNFGSFNNWGSTMGVGGWDVEVGRRAPIFGANTEGANGLIDDVVVYGGDKWSVSDFNNDFAVVVPEPSAAVLALGALLARRRLRK